jgi:hypothetical protein
MIHLEVKTVVSLREFTNKYLNTRRCIVKVIKFPQETDRVKETDRLSNGVGKLFLGPFSYTCPCGNKSTFEPQNLIFRSVDFFCPKCGTYHKIMNPAFTPAPAAPPAKSKR